MVKHALQVRRKMRAQGKYSEQAQGQVINQHIQVQLVHQQTIVGHPVPRVIRNRGVVVIVGIRKHGGENGAEVTAPAKYTKQGQQVEERSTRHTRYGVPCRALGLTRGPYRERITVYHHNTVYVKKKEVEVYIFARSRQKTIP